MHPCSVHTAPHSHPAQAAHPPGKAARRACSNWALAEPAKVLGVKRGRLTPKATVVKATVVPGGTVRSVAAGPQRWPPMLPAELLALAGEAWLQADLQAKARARRGRSRAVPAAPTPAWPSIKGECMHSDHAPGLRQHGQQQERTAQARHCRGLACCASARGRERHQWAPPAARHACGTVGWANWTCARGMHHPLCGPLGFRLTC